ncbi:hypothetical protein, partial [Bacillus thuringiensis]|uniref:hypothetical protein n=1 Tax=Bacillus thuringiensis TaxID=1428 RepID=UPI001CB9186C
QVKVIVYETLYLLEMPKSRFKKVAASLCTFLCISLHFLLAQNKLQHEQLFAWFGALFVFV